MYKISVVTAVYNRASTIEETIRSIACQTHSNIEHIIQDGGSTDGTVEIAKSFSSKRISVVSEPDTGIYDGINKGIKRANGDIIGLMHSDDFFASPEILTHVSETLQNKELDGVYGDLDYVSEADTSKIIRKWRSGSYNERKLKMGWMPPHPTLYLRREVFEKYGLYDTSFRISADYDAILRYLLVGKIKIGYLEEVMVKMRVGGESNATLKKITTKSLEDYRALKKNNAGGIASLIYKNFSKIGQFL